MTQNKRKMLSKSDIDFRKKNPYVDFIPRMDAKNIYSYKKFVVQPLVLFEQALNNHTMSWQEYKQLLSVIQNLNTSNSTVLDITIRATFWNSVNWKKKLSEFFLFTSVTLLHVNIFSLTTSFKSLEKFEIGTIVKQSNH